MCSVCMYLVSVLTTQISFELKKRFAGLLIFEFVECLNFNDNHLLQSRFMGKGSSFSFEISDSNSRSNSDSFRVKSLDLNKIQTPLLMLLCMCCNDLFQYVQHHKEDADSS